MVESGLLVSRLTDLEKKNRASKDVKNHVNKTLPPRLDKNKNRTNSHSQNSYENSAAEKRVSSKSLT